MKKVLPYKTIKNALVALDNGGRLYNLLTQASDGNVSPAELARVAGVYRDKQKMILYLEMSIAELDDHSVKSVRSSLTADLKSAHKRYRPQRLVPSEAQAKGKLASSAIITGVPKFMKANSDFNGFIMVPLMSGKTMSMMMIPIIDQYDVYELRDKATAREFIIAHARGAVKLPPRTIRCGGILKELKTGKVGTGKPKKYLESLYYTPV